ncbi:MAG: hypothetical protein ACW98D_08320 [Promethearchaeota archaeon]|jgi:hypothetical protein
MEDPNKTSDKSQKSNLPFIGEKIKNLEKKGLIIQKVLTNMRPRSFKESMENQLKLIAWYDLEEKVYLTLQEVYDKKIEPEFLLLSQKEKAEIAIRRIEEVDDFQRISDNSGKIDQQRALKEIGWRKNKMKRKKPTKLGEKLIKLECREIIFALKMVKQKKQEVN